MDWKFWVPVFLNVIGLGLNYMQLLLTKGIAMQGSPMASPQVPKSFIRTYWPTLITFILAVSVWIPYLSGLPGGYEEWNNQPKIPVLGKTFINETVVLDGHSYSNCTFKNVRLVYNGKAPFDMVGNTINGAMIVTDNPALDIFIRFMKELGALNVPFSTYDRKISTD